jgi:hypothetical protein
LFIIFDAFLALKFEENVYGFLKLIKNESQEGRKIVEKSTLENDECLRCDLSWFKNENNDFIEQELEKSRD